jgi:glycogen synthase
MIFTAGRLWDEAKNIRALGAIARDLPWPVYAAGALSHPDGGEQEIEGLTCLGMLDRESIARWMGRAAIFALPAWYEPFGLGVLEAALAGCTLILGDIPSLRETWKDAAVFVPPGNREKLRKAVTDLIDRPDLRESLAQKSHRRAAHFTPGRMAARYHALYTNLLERVVVHPMSGKVHAR